MKRTICPVRVNRPSLLWRNLRIIKHNVEAVDVCIMKDTHIVNVFVVQ